MSQTTEIVPATILRNLQDKKTQGGEEIEALVKKYQNSKDIESLKQVISTINQKLTTSPQPNLRKAGLWGLASFCIGLLKDCKDYLRDIIPKVVNCISDSDNRVRFAACESLYNIVKVSKGYSLNFFSDIFDALCKLSADGDQTIRNANGYLNRLLKDIIVEDEEFMVEKVLPLLKDRVVSNDPFVRQFILGWILVLDAVPEMNLVDHLPVFLGGVFSMLTDPNKEIVSQASTCLNEFFVQLESRSQTINSIAICKILLEHANTSDQLKAEIVLDWIAKLVSISGEKLWTFHSDLIQVILPKVSDKDENIKNKAILCDKKLLTLLSTSSQDISVKKIMDVITKDLAENTTISAQIACLNWLKLLLNAKYDIVMESLDALLELLLKVLHDSSEDVVFIDLEVLALISTSEKNFTLFMSKLVHLFKVDAKLLNKSGFIIRKLSIMLNPEKLYREIAKILSDETHFEFCASFVQILNLVLLTSKELATLRSIIKSKDEKGQDLFSYLFKSWCHNPISTLSLCLLAQSFRDASDLVMSLTEFDINVSLFIQIDNLVQLFESPVFTELRLLLLEPQDNPYLLKTLYGLLMLLPQSSTYEKLAKRLECVPTMTLLQNHIKQDGGNPSSLITHFRSIQQKQFVTRLGDL